MIHLDPQTTDALIKAGLAIIGPLIGARIGFWFGRRHSILRFLKKYKKLLKRANSAIARGDQAELDAVCHAIVNQVMTWRQIQENFVRLLNGLVDELSAKLRQPNLDNLASSIVAIDAAFEANELAIKTALEKSKI